MRHRLRTAGAATALSVVVAACGNAATGAGQRASATGSRRAHRAQTARAGGTAYFAEQPQSPPNYIFPLVSSEYYTVANTADFQTLLYRPLYWFGDGNRPGVDYNLSLGDAPRYSDGDRVVTITLKRARWSDGEPVSARDVGFWIDLLKANREQWASYVPGGFPDNVSSWRALGQRELRLRLNAAYNPIWFTDNELSQITPLPLAWDRTSLHGHAPTASTPHLPDTTTRGAVAVYRFLNGAARKPGSYATSPIWSIVDGPWKLTALSSTGEATFAPNGSYSGPNRPRLARFVELPFTSEQGEFAVLQAGAAGAQRVSVGYVPDTDLPAAGTLRRRGYSLIDFYPYGFDYFEPNFNNPSVGPILRQLYFRQAFQHLVDQRGWIRAYYHGLGVPTYSPVPAQPPNPYADRLAAIDPYPFSVAAAARLLRTHGWRALSGGPLRCAHPGRGAHECGPGIPAGKPLAFNLLYPTGMSQTAGAMIDLQAVARRVGIEITLRAVTPGAIASQIAACTPSQAACGWQLGQYGAAWVFAPDHYPTGEEIFQTGALGNVNNYSSATVDRLIRATTTAPAARAQQALNAYADALRVRLPDFWQPSPGTMITVANGLRGVVPNAYGFISPEEWYFTR